jgi:hypothetical protein
MENEMLKFSKKYRLSILLGLFCLLALSFLIFQKGTWFYYDAGYSGPFSESRNLFFFTKIINVDVFFGFDQSQFVSSRFLNIAYSNILKIVLGSQAGTIVLYLTFFLLTFFFSYKILLLKFNRNASLFGALFCAFNPLAIFLLAEPGIVFVYPGMAMFLYGLLKYFGSDRIHFAHIFTSFIGLGLVFTYPRLTGVAFIFIFLLALFFWKEIAKILQSDKKKIAVMAFFMAFSFLPLVVSFGFQMINKESGDFSGLANYAENFSAGGSRVYDGFKKIPLFNNFYLLEANSNFAGDFQKSEFFVVFSIVYFFSILCVSFAIRKKIDQKKSKLFIFFVVVFLFSIALESMAHFVPKNMFIALMYKYLMFLANNLRWISVIFVASFAVILSLTIESLGRKGKTAVCFFTIVYILVSLWPLVLFRSNAKLATLDKKNIPSEYVNKFILEKRAVNPSVFFPSSFLMFKWAPYNMPLVYNSKYQELMTNNVRLVGKNSASLYQEITNPNFEHIGNASILNLKNIFVFKDIKETPKGVFDYNLPQDFVQKSKDYYDKAISSKDLNIIENNSGFAQFGFQNSEKNDFSVYLPKKVLTMDADNFFDEKIDPEMRPVIVDRESAKKIKITKSIRDDLSKNDFEIFAKDSFKDRSKYYLKFSNIDTENNFLVQLNQVFDPAWKLKWIQKNDFEKEKCVSLIQNFDATKNSFCDFQPKMLSLGDINYLKVSSIGEKNHFAGNFVGNTWLVAPDDIPENMKGQKELYAVLVYEKQIYYSWALFVSGLALLFLFVLAVWQKRKRF